MRPQNLKSVSQPSGRSFSDRSGSNPGDPVDAICNLFDKAMSSRSPVVNSKYASDPVNAYVEEAFNIKVSSDNPKHPLDEFYDSLQLELSIRRPFVRTSRPLDMVNTFAKTSIAQHTPSSQSAQKLDNLFLSIRDSFIASAGSTSAKDPVNDLAEKQFTLKPEHTFKEVNDLIKKSLGSGYRSIKLSGSFDMINDIVADQLGLERPSEKALSQTIDKLFEATNQLAYKLTPGSDAYNTKAKEIDQLKEDRIKLEDNLKELNK